MKIKEVVTESFEVVKIGGLLRNLSSDEMTLYKKIKKARKLFKKDLNEFDQRIANNMVNKGVIHRKRSNDEATKGHLYFTTIGRTSNIHKEELDEVAPPSKESEKWIKKNKQKFKDRYGDGYEKYLYGHAWKLFNGKKTVKEGYVRRKSSFANTGIMFDDDYIEFEEGMRFVSKNGVEWTVKSVVDKGYDIMVLLVGNNGKDTHIASDILNNYIMDGQLKPIYDEKFWKLSDGE